MDAANGGNALFAASSSAPSSKPPCTASNTSANAGFANVLSASASRLSSVGARWNAPRPLLANMRLRTSAQRLAASRTRFASSPNTSRASPSCTCSTNPKNPPRASAGTVKLLGAKRMPSVAAANSRSFR